MNNLWQSQARWIWLPTAGGLNRYGDFRRTFTLPEAPGQVRLYISADSRYAVSVNGRPVPASQYADYAHYKVYDTVDITAWVHPGQNVLAVLGYFQGEDSSVCRPGEAGVLFAVESECGEPVYSDASTLCRPSVDYVSGEVERVSPQLSFSFHFRAAQQDGWAEKSYRPDGRWSPARETGARPPLCPRPIRMPEWRPRRPARLITQGVFFDNLPPSVPCGERMQRAALAFRPAEELGLPTAPAALPCDEGLTLASEEGDGLYALIDLGAEEAGLLDFELALPQEATVLIGYGEHLDDLRPRTSVGGRQFAAVYQGRAGRQHFTHSLKRIAGRYVVLYVYARSFRLMYAGIRPTVYPVRRRPAFRCADALHNRIFEVSRRTLELCMHEHYEDCPWREQALYAMDSRSQMLFGYYVFDNPEFARASLRLLSLGLREDGLLELCAPARVPVTIPAFSLSFVTAVCEHLAFCGDRAFAWEMLPTVERILRCFWQRREENGLVPRFDGDAYWNFYEWSEGLDGGVIGQNSRLPKTYDAPLNALLSSALADTAGLYERLGEPDGASRCRAAQKSLNAALEQFWDAGEEAYATYLTDTGRCHYSSLSQSLLLLSGAVPESRLDALLHKLSLTPDGWVPVTLSCTLFKYEALLRRPRTYATWVREDIGRIWGGMLYAGATSFWETARGGWDFDRAGSLCHGWSAVPLYFYYRYVLGIRPDGRREEPLPCGLYEARLSGEGPDIQSQALTL